MPYQYCACFCVCCNQHRRRIIAYFALEEVLCRSYASFALPLCAFKSLYLLFLAVALALSIAPV